MSEVNLSSNLKGLRVLVVEDDLMSQKIADLILSKEGCHVTTAINAKDALALFQSQPYDLILTDLKLPMMTGCEMLEKIRGEYHSSIPVFAVSAYAHESEKQDCIKKGMNGFLSKPINVNELKDAVGKFI